MFTRRSIVYLFLIAVFLLSLSAPTARVFAGEVMVSGTSITVTTTADEYDAVPNGQCSLREAITAANTNTAYGGCPAGSGDDTIYLGADTYSLTIIGSDDDANIEGDLDIFNGNLTISAKSSANTTIDADGLGDRVFDVQGEITVQFQGVKISNGHAPSGGSNANGENGGGIRSSGNVFLDDVMLYTNYAGNGGDETGDGGHGGGIYSAGSLTITNSVIQGNKAGNGGSTTSVISTAGDGGNGGGIMALGSLDIANSNISSNYAGNSGNGVLGQQSFAGNAGGGGGIYTSNTSSILHSEIHENYGGNVGAGPSGLGGNGGGIYNAGTITIDTSSLWSNRPGNGKSSLLVPPGYGGGFFNANGATAMIILSSIYSNTTPDHPNGFRPKAAGIYNAGNLSITNTTITKNAQPYEGGGIYNTSSGVITINASTIAYNDSQYGGGIYNVAGGSVTMMNTILALNVGWQGGYDCNGEVNSGGYNLIRWESQPECTIVGDMSGVLLNMVPSISAKTKLDYYGGETKTLIPLNGSPVIDAGNPAEPGSGGGACPAVDQRGVSRPQSTACDIGAAEATAQFSVSKTVDEVFTMPGQLITFTITVTNIGALDAVDATIYDDLPAGLIFTGPVEITPAHPEAVVALSAVDLPYLVTGLDLASGASVTVTLPVTTDVNYPGGEIISNTALAFTAIPQTEGSGYRNIQTGWRVMLPLILR